MNMYPFNQSLQPWQQQYMPVMQPPQMEIPKVSGEESARSYQIGPNSSVILMDTNQPLIWVVTTDSSGYKTVTPFTVTPYTPEQPVSTADLKSKLEEINGRLAKLEERMNSYGQSNSKPSWQNKSGNGNAQPNDRNGSGGKGSNGSD